MSSERSHWDREGVVLNWSRRTQLWDRGSCEPIGPRRGVSPRRRRPFSKTLLYAETVRGFTQLWVRRHTPRATCLDDGEGGRRVSRARHRILGFISWSFARHGRARVDDPWQRRSRGPHGETWIFPSSPARPDFSSPASNPLRPRFALVDGFRRRAQSFLKQKVTRPRPVPTPRPLPPLLRTPFPAPTPTTSSLPPPNFIHPPSHDSLLTQPRAGEGPCKSRRGPSLGRSLGARSEWQGPHVLGPDDSRARAHRPRTSGAPSSPQPCDLEVPADTRGPGGRRGQGKSISGSLHESGSWRRLVPLTSGPADPSRFAYARPEGPRNSDEPPTEERELRGLPSRTVCLRHPENTFTLVPPTPTTES